MTDELRNRISRLDPMSSEVPTEPVTSESSRHLLEEIMSQETGQPAEPQRKGVWYAVGAAALVVVVIGAVSLFGGEGTPTTTVAAAGPPLELTAPGDDPMAMCIMYSVEELAKMQIAFEGTVTSVEGETITLDVDHWFKGGDAEQVVLTAPAGMEALIGGIPFEEGGQYLITAWEDNVNYCGFSGPSTPEFRADFEEAFGS